MSLHAAATASSIAAVSNLMLHRLERALRERVRYRYVRPMVLQEGEAFRIQSPNCSRKVDPSGGVIDIALLVPHGSNRWCLCSRDTRRTNGCRACKTPRSMMRWTPCA